MAKIEKKSLPNDSRLKDIVFVYRHIEITMGFFFF